MFVVLGALLLGAAPASASSVSGLTVVNGSPSNGAGARTQYVATFATSASGALASGGTITVTFPADTTFGNFGGGRVFVGTTQVANCTTPSGGPPQSTCTLFGAIAPSTTARLEFNGVTNPSTPGSSYGMTVATSSDTAPISSNSYSVVAANTLSDISVANASPSNGAGSRTQYVIGFTTTATGGLSSTGTSTIDVTFPAGTTTFANFGGGRVFVGTTQVANCTTPDATRKSTCSLFGTIAPSTTARLEYNGVTNPAAGSYALTVATSSDTATISSNSYTVAPANTLTNLSATPGSSAQSGTTQYVIGFTTTATGGLSSTGTSTIDVTFPAGTTFANFGGGRVFVGTTQVANCTTPDAIRKSTCSRSARSPHPPPRGSSSTASPTPARPAPPTRSRSRPARTRPS